MDDRDQAQALSCLREGLAASSGWRIQPEQISLETRLSDTGGFTWRAKETLNRRLLLSGLPPDNLISVDELNARGDFLTVGDVYDLIKQDWLKAYCPDMSAALQSRK